MGDEKLRDTGNHAKPIRANHAVAELMWEEGECFRLVPRAYDGHRSVEMQTVNDDGYETTLILGADSLRIIQKEMGRALAWMESKS